MKRKLPKPKERPRPVLVSPATLTLLEEAKLRTGRSKKHLADAAITEYVAAIAK